MHIDSTNENLEQVDEKINPGIPFSLAILLLAIPRFLPAAPLQSSVKKSHTASIEKTISADTITNAITDVTKNGTFYSGYSAAAVSNIIARTLWLEARGEGTDGISAVASVIYNRAGGMPDKMVSVVFAKKQFSCWNKISPNSNPEYTPHGYKITVPKDASKNKKNIEVWEYCKTVASDMVNQTFKSTVGLANSYYNSSIVTPSWSSSLINTQTVGNHVFGYLKNNDGFKNTKLPNNTSVSKSTSASSVSSVSAKFYTVKNGDSLSKIAKNNNTTVDKIKTLNKLKNADRIKIGQKLRIN